MRNSRKCLAVGILICILLSVINVNLKLKIADISQLNVFIVKNIDRLPVTHIMSSVNKSLTRKTSYTILYWTVFTSAKSTNNWFGLGNVPVKRSGCEFQNCFFTNDRSEYNTSDAVMFYIFHAKDFPRYKFPWQKWVLRTDESPANGMNFTRYNGLFNATWTYHSKSDIYTHTYYNQFVPLNDQEKANNKHKAMSLEGKQGSAWLVGKCFPKSQRSRLVKALQKYVKVDIYGKCGPMRCGADTGACERMMGSNYKFYIAFENSLCEEYVTEKLWRAYQHNLVPIVMGGSNYSSYLPEHSYIDVGSFSTVKELADYLTLLEGNDTLYREYFNWKNHFRITYYPPDVCGLCRYMNMNENVTKVYDRMDLFWNPKTDCSPPQVYYKDIFSDIELKATDLFANSLIS